MRLFIQFFILLNVLTVSAQGSDFTPPRLVKKAISTSGCFAYFPEESDTEYEISYSPDSSVVYTGDFASGDFHFSIILVKFHQFSINTPEEKEDLLVSYMDYLQGLFSIELSAGYGKGHTHPENTEAIGIIDYWQDSDGDQWSVKGWIDNTTLAVMCIYGPTDYPNVNIQQLYFNGFRFK